VAVVWSECRIVRQRKSRQMQSEAVIMQTVIASLFSKDAGTALTNLLKGMEDVG